MTEVYVRKNTTAKVIRQTRKRIKPQKYRQPEHEILSQHQKKIITIK